METQEKTASDRAPTRIMNVLVDEQSLADYRRAAEADGRTLSGWVRMVLSREAASMATKSE